jgi:hypothetical protein
MVIGSWLFSVKGYTIDHGTIRVQHPLWSGNFEVRGLTSEDRRPLLRTGFSGIPWACATSRRLVFSLFT